MKTHISPCSPPLLLSPLEIKTRKHSLNFSPNRKTRGPSLIVLRPHHGYTSMITRVHSESPNMRCHKILYLNIPSSPRRESSRAHSFLHRVHNSQATNQSHREREREKMSWQAYVDDHLLCDVDGQHLTAAAIIGHDGSVWASSATFPEPQQGEIDAIMKDFDEPGTIAPTGLFLGGAKYMVIQGEPGAVIRGKKGTGGVCVKKTTMAIIIGIYDEPMTPGQCNVVVERLGDYLIEQGY